MLYIRGISRRTSVDHHCHHRHWRHALMTALHSTPQHPFSQPATNTKTNEGSFKIRLRQPLRNPKTHNLACFRLQLRTRELDGETG